MTLQYQVMSYFHTIGYMACDVWNHRYLRRLRAGASSHRFPTYSPGVHIVCILQQQIAHRWRSLLSTIALLLFLRIVISASVYLSSVCLSVCLPARVFQISRNFLCMLPVAVSWSSSDDSEIFIYLMVHFITKTNNMNNNNMNNVTKGMKCN